MQIWIEQNLDRVSGMILLASEITDGYLEALNQTVIPIYQISGDLDGLVMVTEVDYIFR